MLDEIASGFDESVRVKGTPAVKSNNKQFSKAWLSDFFLVKWEYTMESGL